jgi:Zn-finger nucleic acid-binding protein
MTIPPCPVCDGRLAPLSLGDGTEVITCASCGGAFFPKGALARALDAREDLRITPPDDAPTGGACPACASVLLQRVPFALGHALTIERCPYCEGVFAKLSDLPAMRRIPEARRPPPRGAPAAVTVDPDAPDFASLSLPQSAFALPVALAVAWLLRASGVAGLVLGGARIPLHELGHALAAWFCGFSALPIPFGMTWLGDARAVSVWLLLAVGLGAAVWRLFRAGERAWAGLFAALLVLQQFATWATTDSTRRLLITFGGSAGELLLSATLVALFHARLPARLRWDQARWIALFVGAFILVNQTLLWREARLNHELIPWGSVMGEDGDMQRLERDHGWAPSRIAMRYAAFAHASCALAATAWITSLGASWRRRVAARGGAMH